mmetsp:Transcript_54357/g.167286  ORF Transcript_54357/g.167286 Transcript_54357/m.167286 type:complete len:253 (-) Transcript_54357:5788-6546(-)
MASSAGTVRDSLSMFGWKPPVMATTKPSTTVLESRLGATPRNGTMEPWLGENWMELLSVGLFHRQRSLSVAHSCSLGNWQYWSTHVVESSSQRQRGTLRHSLMESKVPQPRSMQLAPFHMHVSYLTQSVSWNAAQPLRIVQPLLWSHWQRVSRGHAAWARPPHGSTSQMGGRTLESQRQRVDWPHSASVERAPQPASHTPLFQPHSMSSSQSACVRCHTHVCATQPPMPMIMEPPRGKAAATSSVMPPNSHT